MTDPADELERRATDLADGIDRALPGWVTAAVGRIWSAWTGGPLPPPLASAAAAAAEEARRDVGARVRALIGADPDEQRTTPLALVREAVRYPTEVLAAAGVPPVERDEFAVRAFPADRYGLTPASYADVDPSLADVGLAWGAAKAFVHRRRHC